LSRNIRTKGRESIVLWWIITAVVGVWLCSGLAIPLLWALSIVAERFQRDTAEEITPPVPSTAAE
jgi:hypothetical protein